MAIRKLKLLFAFTALFGLTNVLGYVSRTQASELAIVEAESDSEIIDLNFDLENITDEAEDKISVDFNREIFTDKSKTIITDFIKQEKEPLVQVMSGSYAITSEAQQQLELSDSTQPFIIGSFKTSQVTIDRSTDENPSPNFTETDSYEQSWLLQNQNFTPATSNDEWPEPIDDSQIFSFFSVDQLEYRINEGEDTFNWDAIGWIGGDYQRLWIETEGDIGLDSGDGEAELQLLYGKLIDPFWDFQAGIRYDQLYSSNGGPGRTFGVIGVQGLAPYLFEVDASLFVSQDGDISARLTAEYQLLLTQQLILQPEFETNIAIQQVEEFGVGSGLNDIELGLRLRYEFSRRFAPYVGVNWTHQFGDTADFARAEGEQVDNFAVVGGFRLLF